MLPGSLVSRGTPHAKMGPTRGGPIFSGCGEENLQPLSGNVPHTEPSRELDEPDLLHLDRLVIDFNRKGYGRLRRLIDAINEFE